MAHANASLYIHLQLPALCSRSYSSTMPADSRPIEARVKAKDCAYLGFWKFAARVRKYVHFVSRASSTCSGSFPLRYSFLSLHWLFEFSKLSLTSAVCGGSSGIIYEAYQSLNLKRRGFSRLLYTISVTDASKKLRQQMVVDKKLLDKEHNFIARSLMPAPRGPFRSELCV
ncbi:hypothetical protein BDV11DRAFT_150121 [Aspergillus similis]